MIVWLDRALFALAFGGFLAACAELGASGAGLPWGPITLALGVAAVVLAFRADHPSPPPQRSPAAMAAFPRPDVLTTAISDGGRAFLSALEAKGYTLAPRGSVTVDADWLAGLLKRIHEAEVIEPERVKARMAALDAILEQSAKGAVTVRP